MLEKVDFFPNAFYDFIVFIGSTVVFFGGLFVGFGGLNRMGNLELQLQGIDVLLIFGMLILIGYEYGRIAEAWSAVIVQKPLQFISSHTPFLKSKDFLSKPPIPKELGIVFPSMPEAKRTDKWTIYFYASMVHPGLGSDLLKRYAWEKLSRNSAFSYCILFIISISSMIFQRVLKLSDFGSWSFGTTELSVLIGIMTLLTFYEYYKRNCWNNDLLIKAMPILITLQRHRLKIEKLKKQS